MVNKKWVSFMLALGISLTLGIGALAQEGKSIELDGVVKAKQSISILAPAAGLLEDYTLTIGQRVNEGEELFALETQKTYAPWTGTVRGIKAAQGHNLQASVDRYTAALFIDPVETMVIEASAAQAYNEEENKWIYPGEKVFLLSTATKDRSALGTITNVQGQAFTVEVDGQGNTLRLNERVGIYRDSDHDSKSRLGYGVTAKSPLIPVIGSGTMVALHVEEGQKVEKDDLLFETLDASEKVLPLKSNEITAPITGIITALPTAPAAMVSADQLLATIADDSLLQITASLSESDYGKIHLEDQVTITFDAYPDEKPVKGTISSIGAFSTTETGEKEYEVKVDFTPNQPLPLGLEATVTITP